MARPQLSKASTHGAGIAADVNARKRPLPYSTSAFAHTVRWICMCTALFKIPPATATPLELEVYDADRVEFRLDLAPSRRFHIVGAPHMEFSVSLESSQHSSHGLSCSSSWAVSTPSIRMNAR